MTGFIPPKTIHHTMKAILFRIILLYAVTNIVCTAASCPCHIPCTGKPEVCTCFGPRGDDGYACTQNGDDYQFLSQSKCSETEWIVQCIRKSACSARSLLDDSNPFAAYELRGNNVLQSFDAYDDDGAENNDIISAAHSSKWFGGNWFDFWGQNEDQFFLHDDDLETAANTDTKSKNSDFDDLSIDSHDDDAFTIESSKKSNSRSLTHSGSELSVFYVHSVSL